MTSFVQKKWGDVCTLEYGKGIRDYKNEDNDYSVYGSAGRIGTHSKFHLDKGVIVSRKGTLDVHYSDEPFFVIDTAFFLKAKSELNAKWAYYALKNFDIKKLISGSGVPSLSRDEFYLEDLFLPALEYQDKVQSILSNIDKKIELNQKMNETLEEIAKTLFKSWFIDFDPVRAKVEGRPTGLSKEISDLFPDTFEESELGEIPEGWKVCELKEILDRLPVGKRYSNKNSLQDGKTPIIDQSIDGIIGYHNNDDFIEASSSIPVMTFANHTCNLRLVDFNFSTIQNVIPLTSKDLPILWTYIRSQGLQKFEEYRGHIPDFLIKKIHVPNKLLADKFESIIKTLYSKIFLNKKGNKILTSLRDALLPKLISGELKIPDAENLIQEAGI